MYSELPTLIGLILLSGIFSGSETALVSVSESKVDELVAKKVKNAKLLRKLRNDPHKLLITVLIGNNIVNIGASAYAAVLFTEWFGSSGVGIATGVMTFLILIFGEITPKSFCHQHAVSVSLFIVKPIRLLQLLLFPFVWFFERIVDFVGIVFGSKKGYSVTEGEIVAMLKIGEREGAIDKQEKEFIENVLEFNDIDVEAIMTPRVAIEAIDNSLTIKKAVDFVIRHSHSRIPVFEGTIDNIVGIISIKELLKYFNSLQPDTKISSLKLKPPLEVPTTKKINHLFREFQRKHVHIAIVLDEHGGTEGLITLEDLLEEIVGEIVDESDIDEKTMEIIDTKNILASGATLVEDINDFFQIKFAKNDHDNLNSLLAEKLHRFPREGEIVKFPRVRIQITKMRKNLVVTAKITKLARKRK
jgi:putative hemolysin